MASVDETGTREALVEQLAEAMHRACCAGPDWRSCKYDSNLAWERFAEAAAAQVEAAVSVVRQQAELSRANAEEAWNEKNEQWISALERAEAAERQADEWAATADRWTHRAAENGRRAESAEAAVSVARAERDVAYSKGYQSAREHWKGRTDAAEEEASRLVEWSNELATLLPEDADGWPGVNPEGAQESIISKCLTHLLGEVERLETVADSSASLAEFTAERFRGACDRAESAESERDALREKVARVEALHQPTSPDSGPDFCKTCSESAHEWVKWPCAVNANLPCNGSESTCWTHRAPWSDPVTQERCEAAALSDPTTPDLAGILPGPGIHDAATSDRPLGLPTFEAALQAINNVGQVQREHPCGGCDECPTTPDQEGGA